MRLLDLFCGAGGAAAGYADAGFTEIVGVDIAPQPNYPFEFVQNDVLSIPDPWATFEGFDLVHASPPCQRYSVQTGLPEAHPDLVVDVRALLQDSGLPYVIENVPAAPLEGWIVELCGSMFGLQLQRHRRFELSGFPMVLTPTCNHKAWEFGRAFTVTGHADGSAWDRPHHMGPWSFDHAKELMGMPWAKTRREVTEAIPPAYTKFIGEQFISQHASILGDEK